MSAVLLLDLDHTLYPSTAPTLNAVDARITRFIETRLQLDSEKADAMRRALCTEHGTTLRGLELRHGVCRHEYTDFIQDLADELMPLPDPALRAWLLDAAQRLPTYLFTNARSDWAHRCLRHIGISDLVAGTEVCEGGEAGADAGAAGAEAGAAGAEAGGGRASAAALAGIFGIFDIDFMAWEGKPNRAAYEKVEAHVFARHPDKKDLIFADDRLENLVSARARGWRTVWVRPHDAPAGLGGGHHIVDRITELDLDAL